MNSTQHASSMHTPVVVVCRPPATGAIHVIALLQACHKRFRTDEANPYMPLRNMTMHDMVAIWCKSASL